MEDLFFMALLLLALPVAGGWILLRFAQSSGERRAWPYPFYCFLGAAVGIGVDYVIILATFIGNILGLALVLVALPVAVGAAQWRIAKSSRSTRPWDSVFLGATISGLIEFALVAATLSFFNDLS